MPTWLIWVIVVVGVLVVAYLAITLGRNRRAEQRRSEAAELRQDASAHSSALTESKRQAEEAKAEADLAKAEAARAQERAAAADQAHQVDQAAYEDKVRTADQVDPDVDTKSEDYQPDAWSRSESASDTTRE